jgi:hypothetical protein
MSCPLVTSPRPITLGALGTSLTWGADLPDQQRQAWPSVLQSMLRKRARRDDVFVFSGALRASSADFAALCFDELWGPSWSDARGVARAPRLDLAIVEYNWSSSAAQVAALVDALHARGIAVVGVLYYHPVNIHRLGKVKNDDTPWKNANSVGKHHTFVKVFHDRGVPFVNTSVLNEQYGWRAMLNTTKGIMSAAHLSPIGHVGIARLLTDLLLDTAAPGNAGCVEAFSLPRKPAVARGPALRGSRHRSSSSRNGGDGSNSGDGSGSGGGQAAARRQVDADADEAASAASAPGHSSVAPADYFCRIGSSLSDIVVEERSGSGGAGAAGGAISSDGTSGGGNDGAWKLVSEEGRTPGFVAGGGNATLRLSVPMPTGGRFLSLGFEKSARHRAHAAVSCAGACICAPLDMDVHSTKKYTYLQRSPPRWLMPISPAASSAPSSASLWPRGEASVPGAWCTVVVRASKLESGRLMLKALTLSSARAGNKSVSTNSLYSLP